MEIFITLIKYNNRQLLVVCYLISILTPHNNAQRIYEKWGILINFPRYGILQLYIVNNMYIVYYINNEHYYKPVTWSFMVTVGYSV